MTSGVFDSFLRKLGSLPVWAALSTISLPFLAASAGVITSWPPYIEYITAACQLLGLLYVSQFYNSSSMAAVRKSMKLSAIVMLVSFICYLFIVSQFAIRVPGYNFVIIGYQCTRKAAETYDECPFLGSYQLASANYNEYDLWTASSLTIMRIAVTLLWLVLCMSLTIFVWCYGALRRVISFGLLNEPQSDILRLAILSTFANADKFATFLQERFNIRRVAKFASGEDYQQQVASVIKIAQSGGWIDDLIGAMQDERPDNPLICNLPIALRLAEKSSPPRRLAAGMDLEKIVRNGGFKDLRMWAEKMTTLGQAVCRIEFPVNGGTGYGTGLLVADDLVLTNYHVVEKHIGPGVLDPATIRCRFDYARDVKGLGEGRVVSLAGGPGWIVAHSAYDETDLKGVGTPAADHLDFALLRLAEAAGRDEMGGGLRRGTIPLREPKTLPSSSEPIFIVQHPMGRPLALAIGIVRDAVTNLRVRYDADTEGGSSGSGVFNQALELVALHHAGDPSSKIRAEYNQGIPIGLIVTMLRGTELWPSQQ